MPAGRPTKYSEEMLAKAVHYLDHYEECGDAIPSIAGLSVELNVDRSTVYEWNSEDKPEFSSILSKILSTQERVLINKGLLGDYNSNIVKLALGKHGYHDRQELSHSSPDGSMTPVDKITIEVISASADKGD